jgi:hypothetical protein
MSHHTATLQATSQTIATLHNASLAITDLLYWIDDEYYQPFIKWVAPRLQDAAVSALVWTVISIIKFCLWLMATIERCAATDAIAIALMAWAQAYAPAPEVLALAPAAVVSVDAPGHGWRGWISRQLSQMELAIATDNDKGIATDPWEGDCDWEYSELSPALLTVASNQPRTPIALLPPAKEPQIEQKPQQRGKAKPSRKTSQKRSHKGKQLSLR